MSAIKLEEPMSTAFTIIDEAEAPAIPTKAPGRLEHRKREYEEYISRVHRGFVGRMTPTGTDTPRGIALRVARAGKRTGTAIQTWVVDNAVYFSTDLDQPVATVTAGRKLGRKAKA